MEFEEGNLNLRMRQERSGKENRRDKDGTEVSDGNAEGPGVVDQPSPKWPRQKTDG